jgi:hypothetical protein
VTPAVSVAAAALILSLNVAICAAAPEFIWSGLLVALAHPSWADLVSALLIGLNLAFFVEPAMERLRDWLGSAGSPASHERRPRNLLFTASLSLAFAVVSVCLHDAMVAFVSGRGEADATHQTALVAGVTLIIAWAIVPFAVTLAWLSLGCRWLRAPLGIIAAASPGLSGWLFSWPAQVVITTAIPCWLILGFGYHRITKPPKRHDLTRCWRIAARVGALWLAVALLFDAVLGLFHVEHWNLYESAHSFFIDARFYLGWTMGLALAPLPHCRAVNEAAPHPG